MKTQNIIFIVDTHTEGEPTRIILSGLPKLKGKTILKKKEFMQKNFDHLRTAILLEPRGHDDQYGAIILQTNKKNIDYELIFMDNFGYKDMCGHGIIGVTTALIELGMVEPIDPYTEITFETVAGIVKAKANIKNGSINEVSLLNLPSYYVGTFEIEIDQGKIIPVDVAYGGNFYVIADAKNLDTRVRLKNIDKLIKKGIILRDKATEQIEVQHPDAPNISQNIELAMITDDPELPSSDGKNIVVFGNGQFDRSPYGTGTAARLSILYKKGLLNINEPFIHESIINTLFSAKILKTVKVGPYDAVIPEITGRAFITQMTKVIINPNDPLKYGLIF